MRVTHIITRLIVGGAQENTIASVLGLKQRFSHDVQLISGPTCGPEGSLEPLAAAEPGLLTVVPPLVRPVSPWRDAQALSQLTALLRKRAPEIVHTHSGKAGILGRMAARRARVPVIIHTIHGPSFGPFQSPLANFIFRASERFAARFTTHFVTVAQAMTEQYLAAGIGIREQFTRIFSGFPIEPFLEASNSLPLRAQLGLAPDDLVVGKVARLFRLKGHEDLFAIAPALVAEFPQLKFLLVGDGPWRSRFEQMAARLNLEKQFVFAGLVSPAAIPQFFGIMDLVVHLSRREGLPRALPQALAAGRPVIAYDWDGAPEVCRDGETGFLVRGGDRAGLRQRVRQLLLDAELRRTFGQKGRELVKKNFSVERMVSELNQLYLRLHGRPFSI